jgi:coatomer protein complex subunit gamma
VLNTDRASILLECRAFNETPINPRKCRMILAKLVYLLLHSDGLPRREATDIFFSITKLFQVPDPSLRQMVYLAIKELAPLADDVIIVTSSLTKDMNAKADAVCRPNAIRALCRITDVTLSKN